MPATLLYDSQCPFCTRSALRLQRFCGKERLAILSLDAPEAAALPGFNYSRALRAVQLFLENGYLCEGAEAAFNALALRPGFWPMKFIYYFPILRQAADLTYRVAARNRRRCPTCP